MDKLKFFIDSDIEQEIERKENYLEMPIRDFTVTEFYKLVKKNNEVIGVYFDAEKHIVSFIVKEKTEGCAREVC
ncbi:hypothetical protein KA005_56775 [bacterium]|nr:hypothetical protein [bacterium]